MSPNSSVTDATISLLNGQSGSLLSTDEHNPIDSLAAEILTPIRKKRK